MKGINSSRGGETLNCNWLTVGQKRSIIQLNQTRVKFRVIAPGFLVYREFFCKHPTNQGSVP